MIQRVVQVCARGAGAASIASVRTVRQGARSLRVGAAAGVAAAGLGAALTFDGAMCEGGGIMSYFTSTPEVKEPELTPDQAAAVAVAAHAVRAEEMQVLSQAHSYIFTSRSKNKSSSLMANCDIRFLHTTCFGKLPL